MKHNLFVILLIVASLRVQAEENVTFTKATDLYYGTTYSTKYNHQIWFTTEGLTYDPTDNTIEGEDGMVMRLDLFCPSATNIAGTYEIVGPNYADDNYKMNKKYTYWTYFEKGGFLDQKLTSGTCTITCTSKSTYTITYDVQEIDKGPTHKGTIKDITIKAVKHTGGNYTLVPSCKNDPTGLNVNVNDNHNQLRKVIENGRMYFVIGNQRFDALGKRM